MMKIYDIKDFDKDDNDQYFFKYSYFISILNIKKIFYKDLKDFHQGDNDWHF